jgi:3-isopropylmalate dehydrogenase
LKLEQEAGFIEKAVHEVVTSGARTADLGGKLTTRQMADEIIKRI